MCLIEVSASLRLMKNGLNADYCSERPMRLANPSKVRHNPQANNSNGNYVLVGNHRFVNVGTSHSITACGPF